MEQIPRSLRQSIEWRARWSRERDGGEEEERGESGRKEGKRCEPVKGAGERTRSRKDKDGMRFEEMEKGERATFKRRWQSQETRNRFLNRDGFLSWGR